MPEPQPRTVGIPPPIWPESLPDPQANSMTITSPIRCDVSNVLYGPARLRVIARTAPMEFGFTVWLTQQQMHEFEAFYRMCVRDHEGEFYARWIGGSRVVAFVEPYTYSGLGSGFALTGRVVRTRIDTTVCDDFISAVFGAVYRDDGAAPDIYRADLAAVDIYRDDYDLALIAANEC